MIIAHFFVVCGRALHLAPAAQTLRSMSVAGLGFRSRQIKAAFFRHQGIPHVKMIQKHKRTSVITDVFHSVGKGESFLLISYGHFTMEG